MVNLLIKRISSSFNRNFQQKKNTSTVSFVAYRPFSQFSLCFLAQMTFMTKYDNIAQIYDYYKLFFKQIGE